LASSACRSLPGKSQWRDEAAGVSLTALGTFRTCTGFPILPPDRRAPDEASISGKRRGSKHRPTVREHNNLRVPSIPFYFMIYSHIKYTLFSRVLGCSSDMGMIALDATVSVDARVDMPVANIRPSRNSRPRGCSIS
jgi:hypothetical protein